VQDHFGFYIYQNAATLLIVVLSGVIVIAWLSKTHIIRAINVFVAVLIAGASGAAIQLFVLHALFNTVFL